MTPATPAAAVAGTAARIEEAALALFFERGFPATTTREIALASGITAGALYNHFPSKERILASIVGRVHEELEGMLSDAVAGAAGPPARLAALARAHALFHTRYRKEARVANREIAWLPEPERALIVQARRRMRAMFEAALEAGAGAGLFAVVDTTVATLAILNMGIRIADWFRPEGRLRAEEVAEIHAALALRMVEGGSR